MCEYTAESASSSCSRWYAVHCQSHREQWARTNLINQQFRAFLPLREKTRRHARKLETVLAPYFPGYLFVELDPTRQGWRRINGTFGVLRVVMFGEQPAVVPAGIVETLMNASDESGILVPQVILDSGQTIRVLAGPFADLVGQFEQISDGQRVRVLLDLMGARTPVELPRAHVVPA